jgi:hypothetical protein
VYTHKQYSVYIQYKMGGGVAYGVLGLQVPLLANFFDDGILLCLLWVLFLYGAERGGGNMGQGGGGGDEWRLENKEGRQQDTP